MNSFRNESVNALGPRPKPLLGKVYNNLVIQFNPTYFAGNRIEMMYFFYGRSFPDGMELQLLRSRNTVRLTARFSGGIMCLPEDVYAASFLMDAYSGP